MRKNTLKRLKRCIKLGIRLRIKILELQNKLGFNFGLVIVISNKLGEPKILTRQTNYSNWLLSTINSNYTLPSNCQLTKIAFSNKSMPKIGSVFAISNKP